MSAKKRSGMPASGKHVQKSSDWVLMTDADIEWSDDIMNCAECGEPICPDEAYNSSEHKNDEGFAYKVCWSCFEDEMGRLVRGQ